MLSFFIQNFGCRVNQAEAFAWAETLQAGGLRLAEDWRMAGVIVVNTCTLTGRADRDVNRFLRRVTRERPGVRIAITGCDSERLPEDILGSSRVVLALPNREKETLAARLLTLLAQQQGDRNLPITGPGHYPDAKGRLDGAEPYPYRARAYLKIQDGCDNRCTFCVIPSVRGACKSVPGDHVVTRVRELTAAGFREIVLSGIHLSSYGEDLETGHAGSENIGRQSEATLTNLLQRIERVPGLGRLRLSSLDPRKLDESFISHVAGNPRICQHFHLSLQHASSRVLHKMGRLGSGIGSSPDARFQPGAGVVTPETVADSAAGVMRGDRETYFEPLLSLLRALSPDAAIGADIIVGFPGETDEDFEVLEAFLERSPLSYFHVFSYSPRRGTPAAGWPQVTEAVKSARARRLRRLSAAKNLAFRQSFLGKELDAIVIRAPGETGIPADEVIATAFAGGDLEGRGDRGAELLTGNFISVAVPNCSASRRDIVRVRIARVLTDSTEGVLEDITEIQHI